jgi:hypothetical protein
MEKSNLFLILLLLTNCSLTLAQSTTVTGTIIDAKDNSPLSYASIRLKGKAIGCVTTKQGEFTLSLNSSPEAYTLAVSFVGYKTYEVNLTEFIERKDKTIKLEPVTRELGEVTISDGKFDLNEFMAQVSKTYQSTSRTTPHIAKAYFQEEISIKYKPVFFADGTGYSVYMGDVDNQAARSNYKFFYEQVSVNRDTKTWTDQITKLGKTDTHRFGGSDNLNNLRTFELNGPLSSTGKFKYKLASDTTIRYKGEPCLYVNFKGSGQSGWMIIGEDNLHVWMIAYNDSEDIWSSVYGERVEGIFACIYDYYENQHYLSETQSFYKKGDISHSYKLKVVSQKFDKLELSEEEYWLINSLDRFMLNQGKEIDGQVEQYNFSIRDPDHRYEFKEGFKVLAIDPEKNPRYQELLAKLRTFF